MRILLLTLTFTSLMLAAPPCERLTDLQLPGVTISAAQSIPEGPYLQPGARADERPRNVQAFCRVAGVVWPEVRFEVWMPEEWNNKFLGVGNGGLAGSVAYGAMFTALGRGYATASTDTGHQGSSNDGSWAAGHMQRVVDFGYRAIHVTAVAAKAIIAAHYGTEAEHSYFQGCSAGGKQALTEAQRFPGDYDGIIAGDPANYWTRHYIGGHIYTELALDGDGYIPAEKIPVIANAVNQACDELDGIKDGLLNDPRRCHFDPGTIACTAGDGPNCLTAAQVGALRKLYAGARNARGEQIYPGLLPGGEAGSGGWSHWVTGKAPGGGEHAALGIPFMRYVVFDDPNWDVHSFKFDRTDGFDNDVDFTEGKVGAIVNATDPDLRPFRARGGKLIQYHGWSDPDITPLVSLNYYESVVKAVGADTGSFYRLFMVPGMQHCSGGPGPTNFNMLTALEQWVEHGTAPERVIASHQSNGSVDRTRPLCPYPQEAKWTGSGSSDDAGSFVCAAP